jgi:hypothetical protein
MIDIYKREICLDEYCEYEFTNGLWETINVSENSPVFYVKPNDS